MSLYWFIVFPIISALLIYIINKKWTKILIILIQLVFLFFAVNNFILVRKYGPIVEVLGNYTTSIGINLRADIFSSSMVLLTIFLFLCMLIYNYHKTYMNNLLLFLFLILQGLICGLFMSNDLFNIYVIFEVSTIIVSILIVFKKDSKSIYDGIIYLLTNLTSMTFFLLGIGYMYKIFGNFDLTILKSRINLVNDPKNLIMPYVLIITSLCLKSAIMPLFSWLPKAHGTPSAPSIISAILSGLYVKTGLFMLIKVLDLFSPVFNDLTIFLVFGFLTAVIGFILAISQTDIKLILAYSTVSQIGLILFGISIGSDYSYYGAIYHIINHSIFKSTLFLTAGIIIEEYHTRDIREIRGVFNRLPLVSISTIIAIFGITGAPHFNGGFSKYLIQKGAGNSLIFDILFFIINLGTVMCFLKYSMIFRPSKNNINVTTPKKHSVTINQHIVILTLAILCFLGGILGNIFLTLIFNFKFYIAIESYTQKLLIYIVNFIIGIIFYYYFYNKISLFKKIREIELSFNQIVISILVFFSVFLVWTYILTCL